MLDGGIYPNEGPFYIGNDPWYNGVWKAGMDNFQIHNTALMESEIKRAAAGEILF
jgi:hypothetical protein